jgi:hypothetical protein
MAYCLIWNHNAQSCSSVNQLLIIGHFISQEYQTELGGKCMAVAVTCVGVAATEL